MKSRGERSGAFWKEAGLGKVYDEINEAVRQFIAAQKMYFVASAPLGADGHVNLSPKGLDTFRVLSPTRVGYADYTGSGVETIAHLRENGRMTIMFCAFEGRPNILRLYGRGRAIEPSDAEFAGLVDQFRPAAPLRAIVVMDVTRIMDSCGFGVPLYEFKGERDQLTEWAIKKNEDGLREYQQLKNARSLDGLPGLRSAAQ